MLDGGALVSMGSAKMSLETMVRRGGDEAATLVAFPVAVSMLDGLDICWLRRGAWVALPLTSSSVYTVPVV